MAPALAQPRGCPCSTLSHTLPHRALGPHRSTGRSHTAFGLSTAPWPATRQLPPHVAGPGASPRLLRYLGPASPRKHNPWRHRGIAIPIRPAAGFRHDRVFRGSIHGIEHVQLPPSKIRRTGGDAAEAGAMPATSKLHATRTRARFVLSTEQASFGQARGHSMLDASHSPHYDTTKFTPHFFHYFAHARNVI